MCRGWAYTDLHYFAEGHRVFQECLFIKVLKQSPKAQQPHDEHCTAHTQHSEKGEYRGETETSEAPIETFSPTAVMLIFCLIKM